MQNKKWINAMDEVIKVIKQNDTWELATLPHGKRAIGVKWVFKMKNNAKRRGGDIQSKISGERL